MSYAAITIVNAIIKDLTGRKGLRHQWDMIDDDTQEEIRVAWEAVVDEALRSITPTPPESP